MRVVNSVALLSLLGLLLLSGAVSASKPTTPAHQITAKYTFEQYMAEYGKSYTRGTGEFAMRRANFEMALARVLEHNANPHKTYLKGINRFSDWMDEEMKALRGARIADAKTYKSKYETPFVRDPTLSAAVSIDYRKAYPKVLTSVKDQGMCGDCWAHAVTEAIESAYAIKTGELFVLSQQQVTSCTPAHFTCYSCNGSYPRLAYDFVAEAGPNAPNGLVQEWQYSFQSYTGAFPICMQNLTQPIETENSTVGILGYTQIAPNEEQDIVAALNTLGPLSILVDASSWGDYAGGVFTGCQFGPTFGLDHAVLLVGYGHDSATDLDYWIVRNSWSAAWGEDGYIRIARTAQTQCGVTGGLSCQSNYALNISACGPCGMFTDAQFPQVNLSASAPPFLRSRSEIQVPAKASKVVSAKPSKESYVRKAPRAHELTHAYTFEQYVKDHGKGYAKGSDEYTKREAVFQRNLATILGHNANPHATWRAGVNRFTDWTHDELKLLRGSRHEPNFKPRGEGLNSKQYEFKGVPIASQLDYRQAWPPVLTAVKDQSMCGDCWAHAVTESIESSYARSSGQLLVLSQQQITSCTPAENDCFGCNGMYPRYAFEYASTAQYIMEEWVYPFTSFEGNTPACTNQTNPPYPLQTTVQVMGYTQVAPNRQEHVMEALNTLGPLAVLVDASSWPMYESGVFNGCNETQGIGLDHAVLLVGYGYDATVDLDYWIIRNSWNPSFGELGYIRLQKTAVAPCGLNQNGLSCFATTAQPTPACGTCGVLADAQFPITGF